jgi:hypothetical protein
MIKKQKRIRSRRRAVREARRFHILSASLPKLFVVKKSSQSLTASGPPPARAPALPVV